MRALLPKLVLRTLGDSPALLSAEEDCVRLLGMDTDTKAEGVVLMHSVTRIVIVDAQGMAEVDRLLSVEKDPFDLLIALHAGVFDSPALLSRCRQVLLAPFDDALLERHLQAIHCDDSADPLMAELLEHNLIGGSIVMQQLRLQIPMAAKYSAPVAIAGETGTGKELVARAVHYCSSRQDKSFVPVNCAALSDELLLAELFGHEKGAFTDARQARRGLVAQADGGTLFLDEVDSLSEHAQGALLRFLQDQEYRPIGSEQLCHADVRVVCATNRDLKQRVEDAQFREDLFYRLNVIELRVPCLRERHEDIEVLSAHFLGQLAQRYNEPEKTLHEVTLQWMKEYRWPGNVRELENYLHRGFVMSNGPSICAPMEKGDPVALSNVDVGYIGGFQEEKNRVVAQFERNYLKRMLDATKGNLSKAARKAGKERRAFARLVEKHGIDRLRYI